MSVKINFHFEINADTGVLYIERSETGQEDGPYIRIASLPARENLMECKDPLMYWVDPAGQDLDWYRVLLQNLDGEETETIGPFQVRREMTSSDPNYNTTGLSFNVEDFSASDDNIFPQYPYEGYHRFNIRQYLSGEASPYSRQTGNPQHSINTGIVFYDRHMQRLQMLLDATGEPVVVLRRKWSGQRCSCSSAVRGHHRQKCLECFGTGIKGGYDQYMNPDHPEGKIMIRVTPTPDDLVRQREGVRQMGYQPNAWSMAVPALRDSDVIIRFDENSNEEWRYEVLNVTRNVGMFKGLIRNNNYLCQQFQMQRLTRTDIIDKLIYEVDYVVPPVV